VSVRKTRTRELSLIGELDVDLVPVESAAASEPKTPRVLLYSATVSAMASLFITVCPKTAARIRNN